MPRAALLALSATTPATRPYSLTLGGTDLTIGPTGGTGWGTPIRSLRVREEGPGGVSSLAASVNDPSAAIWPLDGQVIEYRDVANAVTYFRGALDHWDSAPAFGDQGRILDLQATGIDALLDWRYVPPMTIAPGIFAGSFLANAIAYVANLEAPELVAPSPTDASGGSLLGTNNGNATYPIGFLQTADGVANLLVQGTWVWGGGTLRSAIASLIAQSAYIGAAGYLPVYPPAVAFTVDSSYRLRVWRDLPADQPDDWTTLTVQDTAGGAVRAENLSYGGDPGDVIRAVNVTGASAAASGWFSDGSGITTGREDGFTDTAITAADQASQRAAAFLATHTGRVRGQFEIRDWTPSATTIHAGGLVSITDAAANATGVYRIYAITRTFNNSGRQNWLVEFGGRAPSLANLTRRLTRTLT